MKKLLILNLIFICKLTSAQVLLPNDYKCIFSETPMRGHGLSNNEISFYMESMRELTSQDDINAYVEEYKKTRDNIYYKTGFTENEYFYEIFVPEEITRIYLTSNKNSYKLFCEYSKQLISAVRKHRKSQTDYFRRINGVMCTSNID